LCELRILCLALTCARVIRLHIFLLFFKPAYALSVGPQTILALALAVGELPFAVLFSPAPEAVVFSPVGPEINTVPFFLVVYILALIAAPICPRVYSSPVKLIV